MMSSSRRAGFSEGKGAVPVDLSLKALFAHRLFDDIHLAAENLRKTLFEIIQVAEIVETRFREICAEAYNDIDIVSGILPARHRAEEGYAHYACGVELLLMCL